MKRKTSFTLSIRAHLYSPSEPKMYMADTKGKQSATDYIPTEQILHLRTLNSANKINDHKLLLRKLRLQIIITH